MNRRNRRLLLDGLAELEMDPTPGMIDSLVAYCDEIGLWNRRMNLVGGSERDVVVRHVLDSLTPFNVLRRLLPEQGGSMIDVGSGAGFPGVPLAIVMPDVSVVLLERSLKRASFLNTVKLLLGLDSVTVEEGDTGGHGRTYDLVVSRAFLPYRRALSLLAPLAGSEGHIVFYAARPPDRCPEEDGYRRCDTPLDVPFLDAERTLVTLSPTGT